MTAQAADRPNREERWSYKAFTLASGSIGYQNARAALNASGKVVPASTTAGLLVIGRFFKKVDASAADSTCTVIFDEELVVERFTNGTSGDAIAATDVGKLCFFMDDQTVSILPSSATGARALAGRIWDVDATKGVAVQRLEENQSSTSRIGTAPAFAANDCVLTAAMIVQDGLYDVPTTAAASTVTLPAAAPSGTRISFAADGTKNGHTVQYRDATGSVVLTTALTASKRHLVVCTKLGTLWFANAYVSP